MTDRLIRWAAAVATAVVAAIAAVISYGHAYELAVAYGESGATARALPLTVDGLIVTCSLVLLDAARRRSRAPVLAWLLLAAGIAATVGANVAHGLDHGIVGAVIAGWPALVAVGSFEMLARLIRGGRPADGDAEDEHQDDEAGLSARAIGSAFGVADQTVRADLGRVRDFTQTPESVTSLDGRERPARPGPTAEDDESAGTGPVATVDPPDVPNVEPVPPVTEVDPALAVVIATARDRFAETLATGARPSIRALRRELRIGHPRATAVRAALDAEDGPAVPAGDMS